MWFSWNGNGKNNIQGDKRKVTVAQYEELFSSFQSSIFLLNNQGDMIKLSSFIIQATQRLKVWYIQFKTWILGKILMLSVLMVSMQGTVTSSLNTFSRTCDAFWCSCSPSGWYRNCIDILLWLSLWFCRLPGVHPTTECSLYTLHYLLCSRQEYQLVFTWTWFNWPSVFLFFFIAILSSLDFFVFVMGFPYLHEVDI